MEPTKTAFLCTPEQERIVEEVLSKPNLVQRTKHAEHGDYQSAVCIELGHRLGIDPRWLATMVVKRLNQ